MTAHVTNKRTCTLSRSEPVLLRTVKRHPLFAPVNGWELKTVRDVVAPKSS
jgi:hypothetical protein